MPGALGALGNIYVYVSRVTMHASDILGRIFQLTFGCRAIYCRIITVITNVDQTSKSVES